MLFDLRGKRKRVVQVVYAALAVLFAVSFVGFGIGSDAAGGIFDALGLGSSDQSTDNPAFEQQIEDAESKLAANPKDEGAHEELVQVHYQAGNDALEVDEATGQISITQTAEQEFQESADAWEDYLKATKKPADDATAIANQAYGVLLQSSDPTSVPLLAKKAVVPAELVADETGGAGPYATLAQYAYFAGDPELGDEATKKAIAEVDASQKKTLQKQLAATAKAAEELEKQIEKQAGKGGGEEAFTNPLEQGLGGGTLPGAPPAPGTPPAP